MELFDALALPGGARPSLGKGQCVVQARPWLELGNDSVLVHLCDVYRVLRDIQLPRPTDTLNPRSVPLYTPRATAARCVSASPLSRWWCRTVGMGPQQPFGFMTVFV